MANGSVSIQSTESLPKKQQAASDGLSGCQLRRTGIRGIVWIQAEARLAWRAS
jgi:hypothetical protein